MGNRLSPEEDAKRYRDGYPEEELPPNVKRMNHNIKFYENKLQSKPDGGTIEHIHEHWWGDYRLLEAHHGYIQWLFPIREEGMNGLSQPLYPHEIERLTNGEHREVVQKRLIQSYRLMLDFYGMKLVDETSGELERAENYKERYRHLDRSFHNYLRITRILKCLGELGLERLKYPFVKHILTEIRDHGLLTETFKSCTDYWGPVVRSKKQRSKIAKIAKTIRQEEERIAQMRRDQWTSRASQQQQHRSNDMEDEGKEDVGVSNGEGEGDAMVDDEGVEDEEEGIPGNMSLYSDGNDTEEDEPEKDEDKANGDGVSSKKTESDETAAPMRMDSRTDSIMSSQVNMMRIDSDIPSSDVKDKNQKNDSQKADDDSSCEHEGDKNTPNGESSGDQCNGKESSDDKKKSQSKITRFFSKKV